MQGDEDRQIRFYRVDGDMLTVTTPWRPSVIFDGRIAQTTLTWVRAK